MTALEAGHATNPTSINAYSRGRQGKKQSPAVPVCQLRKCLPLSTGCGRLHRASSLHRPADLVLPTAAPPSACPGYLHRASSLRLGCAKSTCRRRMFQVFRSTMPFCLDEIRRCELAPHTEVMQYFSKSPARNSLPRSVQSARTCLPVFLFRCARPDSVRRGALSTTTVASVSEHAAASEGDLCSLVLCAGHQLAGSSTSPCLT